VRPAAPPPHPYAPALGARLACPAAAEPARGAGRRRSLPAKQPAERAEALGAAEGLLHVQEVARPRVRARRRRAATAPNRTRPCAPAPSPPLCSSCAADGLMHAHRACPLPTHPALGGPPRQTSGCASSSRTSTRKRRRAPSPSTSTSTRRTAITVPPPPAREERHGRAKTSLQRCGRALRPPQKRRLRPLPAPTHLRRRRVRSGALRAGDPGRAVARRRAQREQRLQRLRAQHAQEVPAAGLKRRASCTGVSASARGFGVVGRQRTKRRTPDLLRPSGCAPAPARSATASHRWRQSR
jgi:hypothetical protein